MHLNRIVWLLLAGLLISGCTLMETEDAPPPTIADFDSLQTAQFLTANAPPAGFSTVTYDPLDASLTERLGWAYTITGRFEGTFDESGDPAEGTFEMQAEANELGEARRVVLSVAGKAISPHNAERRLEGVRFSNDYYFVGADGVCQVGEELASPIADLTAGDVIGGVHRAEPNGQRDRIDDLEIWQYTIERGSVRTPAVKPRAGSDTATEIELWVAPSLNAVVRFDLKITVTGVTLLWADPAAGTVSGVLQLSYELDLSRIDDQPNISIPNGC